MTAAPRLQRALCATTLLATLACGLLSPAMATPPAPAALGVNLIKNPGAESGEASADGSAIVVIPKWANVTDAVVVSYDTGGGFPDRTSPGPGKPGDQFFAGGADNEQSLLTQHIDLSALLMDIDSGTISYKLQAWLGGFASQQDHAVLKVDFLDAANQRISGGQTPTVTAEDRGGVTGFLKRFKKGAVPIGARSANVTLVMLRTEGSYNDGYAEGLSLVLDKVAP